MYVKLGANKINNKVQQFNLLGHIHNNYVYKYLNYT